MESRIKHGEKVPDDLVQLIDGPIDPAEALAHIADPSAGGIDLFIGTTRAETHQDLGPLVALDYAAYSEMALQQIRALLATARGRWPICRAAVLHRLSRVPLGQASVIIAVSAPHRAEAFAACRFLIDELKQSVPIWKKEIYARGGQWRTEG